MAKNESDANNRKKGDSRSCCSLKVIKCCVLLFNTILLVSDRAGETGNSKVSLLRDTVMLQDY